VDDHCHHHPSCLGGGYKAWRYYHPKADDQNLSLAQAAKLDRDDAQIDGADREP